MSNLSNYHLNIGFFQDGVWHTEFMMREATIEDAIASIEKAPSGVSNIRLRIFKAAEQIERIGDITNVDADLLFSLADDDIEPILAAQDDLEKKALERETALKPYRQLELILRQAGFDDPLSMSEHQAGSLLEILMGKRRTPVAKQKPETSETNHRRIVSLRKKDGR